MRWSDLNDHANGMRDALIIIILEWLVLLPVAYYLDHSASVGHKSSFLSLLKNLLKKNPTWRRVSINEVVNNAVHVEMVKQDIIKEVSFLYWTRQSFRQFNLPPQCVFFFFLRRNSTRLTQ